MTLKAVLTNRFEVTLSEQDSLYYIHRETQLDSTISEGFTDYNYASYVFNLTVEELEGN